MGAVGNMRRVDSAFLLVMAAADDKPLRPKAAQDTLRITQTMRTPTELKALTAS